jgi:Ca2+-binding RTX toxin-like protein
VHGGGNLAVQAPVAGVYTSSIAGDTLIASGASGGPTSPLVIYGDTSQDAAWYAGRPQAADVADTLELGPNPNQAVTFYRMPRANPFRMSGDDVIDASAITPSTGSFGADALGVVLYGGAGNDTLRGSALGDVLAGGSGNDTIFGNAGDDRIYGDSGVNVDVVSRALSVPTTDAARPANDNAKSNRDGLLAGQDQIWAGAGDDIVFGDHGVVLQQIVDAQKILIVRRVSDIRTDQPANGADDGIHGEAGRDRLFGGNGADTISGGAGADVIFGDHGHMSYLGADYSGRFDTDITTLDLVESVDTLAAWGKGDTITDDESDDIIIGGQGDDVIDAGTGQNIVFGDHGRILGVDADSGLGADGTRNRPIGDPNPAKNDDDYQVQVLGLVTSIDWGTVNGALNEFGNGADTITTGIGRDMVFGGGGNDTIVANAGETSIVSDGNNIVFGDHGLVDYLAEELHPAGGHHAARTDRPSTHDIDRIWSIESATAMGGHDRITTGRANDIILGGTGDDVILSGDGSNIVIGDNAVLTAAPFDFAATPYSVHEFTLCAIETIGFADADNGNDTVSGGSGNDVLFGGGGGDTIYAGAGDDLVFGDQGRIECKNGKPFIPEISLRPICWNCFPESGYLLFEATNTTGAQGFGNDLLFGEDGSDVLMGQQGSDTLYGGRGDDILIGGSNVAGAHDSHDRIDGGDGHDAIAGDNAEICFRPDAIDVRMRSLDGTLLYGVTPGVDDGLLLVGVANAGNAINTAQPWVNAKNDPRYAARTVTNGVLDKNSGHAEYVIRLLDHADGTSPLLYGNDYIAGGAGETRSSASSATT